MQNYVIDRITVLLVIGVFACGCSSEKKLSQPDDGSTEPVNTDDGGLASDGDVRVDAQSEPADAATKRDGASSDGGGAGQTKTDGSVEPATCLNAGCSNNATCDQSSGVPICTCSEGYEGDGKNCWDLNECARPELSKCDKNATCENVPEGSFTCKCKKGYQGDGVTCKEVDECALNTDDCDANAKCNNTEGGYSCQCNSGFSGDGKSCADIDECKSSAATCHPDANCANTVGSFTCQCKVGFTGNGYATGTGDNVGCLNIDECKGTFSCPVNTRCRDTRGGDPGYICECEQGTAVKDGKCVPLCEIALADKTKCGDHARCHIDITGEAVCTDCESGYKGTGTNCEKYCRDSQDNYLCGANTDCVEPADAGTLECKCKPGFTGNAALGFGCTDIDECANKDTHNCACNSQAECKTDPSKVSYCFNTPGGSACYCNDGYRKEGAVCTNINECTETGTFKHKCDQNGDCVDHIPSASLAAGYECTCKTGYTHLGAVFECTDINECSNNTHNCNLQVSTCENILGAFSCKNINECQSGAAKTHDCSSYATCTEINCETDANNSCTNPNAAGFSCGCNAGFSGNGHGPNSCYCDLSGYWAIRQLGDSAEARNFPITIDAFQYHVWEISRFEYNGETLVGYRKGCGQDLWPEVHVGIIDEIYSTYIPIDAHDQEPLVKSYEFSRPAITPSNGSFITPTEVALAGLTLNDPMNDPWPMDHNAINWVDSDNDGELGYTLQAAGTKRYTRTHPNQTFVYVPTAATVPVERRAACWSAAARVKAHYNITVDASCNVLTGQIVNEKTEGHIRTCTIVPQSQWENTDINCNRAYWSSSVERCTGSEVTTIDNETHLPGTGGVTVTFKAVKVGSLTDAEPTCPFVRNYKFDQ
jgi:hypothetical protein